MRFLVRATVPVDAGNDLVRDPSIQQRMQSVLEDIRPDSVYFCAEHGQRTLYLVVDLSDGAELPRIAEPLWLSLEADVEFIPAMTQEDFGRAQPHIQAAARKYA